MTLGPVCNAQKHMYTITKWVILLCGVVIIAFSLFVILINKFQIS